MASFPNGNFLASEYHIKDEPEQDEDVLGLSYICRLCQGTKPPWSKITSYSESIEFVTHLSVQDGDGLPAFLCDQCPYELGLANNFIRQSLASNDTLISEIQGAANISQTPSLLSTNEQLTTTHFFQSDVENISVFKEEPEELNDGIKSEDEDFEIAFENSEKTTDISASTSLCGSFPSNRVEDEPQPSDDVAISFYKCRLCLGRSDQGTSRPPWTSISLHRESVAFVTKLNVRDGDGFPALICGQCTFELSVTNKFIRRSLESDYVLRSEIQSAANAMQSDGAWTTNGQDEAIADPLQLGPEAIVHSFKEESEVFDHDVEPALENLFFEAENSKDITDINERKSDLLHIDCQSAAVTSAGSCNKSISSVGVTADLCVSNCMTSPLPSDKDGNCNIASSRIGSKLSRKHTRKLYCPKKQKYVKKNAKRSIASELVPLPPFMEESKVVSSKTIVHQKIRSITIAGNKFFCKICNTSCISVSFYQKHLRTHNQGAVVKPFSCGTCRKYFVQEYHLLSHMKSSCHLLQMHNSESNVEFDNASAHDVNAENLKDGLFNCRKCSAEFAHKHLLACHYTADHTAELFSSLLAAYVSNQQPCPVAEMSLQEGTGGSVLHEENHPIESEKDLAKRCGERIFEDNDKDSAQAGSKLCSQQIERNLDVDGMLGHGKKVHNTLGTFECKRCHKKFRNKKALTGHRQFVKCLDTVTYSQYSCAKCKNSYRTKQTMSQHFRQAHSEMFVQIESPKFRKFVESVQCLVCDLSLPNMGFLTSHMEGHFKEGQKCTLCEKTSSHMQGFIYHMKCYHYKFFECACEMCGRKFVNRQRLNLHIKVCEGPEEYGCKKCNHSFNDIDGLLRHVTKSHRDNGEVKNISKTKPFDVPIQCVVCGLRLSCMEILTAHMTAHSKEDLKCSLCGRTFTNSHNFVSHMTDKHYRLRECTCFLCGNNYPNPPALKKHLKICRAGYHLRGGKLKCKCSFCNNSYFERFSLLRHLAAAHEEEVEAYNMIKSQCQSIRKNDAKPYECKLCGKGYANRHCLVKHEKQKNCKGPDKKTGDKSKQFEIPIPCVICGFSLCSMSGLTLHMTDHWNKDLKCKLCERRVISNRSYVQHMIHMHYKHYQCICDKCGHIYLSKSALQKHLVNCQKVKEKEQLASDCLGVDGRYLCHLCDNSYPQRSKLSFHIRHSHEGKERRYRCAKCATSFPKSQFDQHTCIPAARCFACGFKLVSKNPVYGDVCSRCKKRSKDGNYKCKKCDALVECALLKEHICDVLKKNL